MKVLQINTVYPNGSTGKIAAEIHNLCVKENIECISAYRYAEKQSYPDTVAVSSWFDCHFHNRIFGYTMLQGCFSYLKTKKFLKWVKKYNPDIIHLHNIHGSYINHGLLFRFIKKYRYKVVWTLHDCWSFTGFCPYYDMVGCEKWKSRCNKCPQKNGFIDFSALMHRKKKSWFSGLDNPVLVANSKWTAAQAKQSFMKDYEVEVIYNGLDLAVFTPTESDFKNQYSCEDKKLVLGVAFGWDERKGLDVFCELAKRLPSDYQIVLVGTNDCVDGKIPANIISIHRTNNQNELAAIYTAADVFVNPTREEAFGLVNVEALACGTPGVTFRTGGSPECYDASCGAVVDKDDIDALESEIIRICEQKPYSAESCVEFAKNFDKNSRYKEYIELYKRIYNE